VVAAADLPARSYLTASPNDAFFERPEAGQARPAVPEVRLERARVGDLLPKVFRSTLHGFSRATCWRRDSAG
jgi:hypothetical protein